MSSVIHSFPCLFLPVPGTTAASAVIIGALADESLSTTAPHEAPGATREGACAPPKSNSDVTAAYPRPLPAAVWKTRLWPLDKHPLCIHFVCNEGHQTRPHP